MQFISIYIRKKVLITLSLLINIITPLCILFFIFFNKLEKKKWKDLKRILKNETGEALEKPSSRECGAFPGGDTIIPKKDEHVLFREEEGESIIFLPEFGRLKKLNPMSTVIWNLMDGKRGADEIAREIFDNIKTTSVTEEKVREDVVTFLEKLKEGGFISYE